MIDLTLWEPDQCECGDDLFFEQAKNLPEGHIFEDSEMTCGDESCDLISQVSFNDDGSSYSTSYKPDKPTEEG